VAGKFPNREDGGLSQSIMKILWVNPHFLHPTTKGGQIRTLEMLRHLNCWHEIHYVALENPAEPEGVAICRRAVQRPSFFKRREI
jgi:hypothetical protein